jgi:hypothetical protein
MNNIKNTLCFLASFIVVGLFVLLINQMYPTESLDKTSPLNKASLQLYTNKNILQEINK